MLSTEQIELIARKANQRVDVPVIGERFEHRILVFGVKRIDKALDEHLPEDFAVLLDDVSDGLEPGSPADLEKIKIHLVEYLNRYVDIPVLGEKGEHELFNLVIGMVIDSLCKDKQLA